MTRDNLPPKQTIEHRLLKQRSRRLLGNVLRRRMTVDTADGYGDELRYNFARRSPNYSVRENDFADALEKLKAMQQKILRAHAHVPATKFSGSNGITFSSPATTEKKFSPDSNANYMSTLSSHKSDRSKPPFLCPPASKHTLQDSLRNGEDSVANSKTTARNAISNALFQSMNFKQFKKQSTDRDDKPAQSHGSSQSPQSRFIPINVIIKNGIKQDESQPPLNGSRSCKSSAHLNMPKPSDRMANGTHSQTASEKTRSFANVRSNKPKTNAVNQSIISKGNLQTYQGDPINVIVDESKQRTESSPNADQVPKFRIKKISIAGKPQEQHSKDKPSRNYVTGVKVYKQSLPKNVTISLNPTESLEQLAYPEKHVSHEEKQNKYEGNNTEKDKIDARITASSRKSKQPDKRDSFDHQGSTQKENSLKSPDVAKESKKLSRARRRSQRQREVRVTEDSSRKESEKKAEIPKFYFPTGKPRPKDELETTLKKISDVCAHFQNRMVPVEEMGHIAKACNVSEYWKGPLFHSASAGNSEAAEVSEEAVKETWKRITSNNNDASSRFVALLAKPGKDCLDFEDFLPLLKDIVDSHPGLIFLKDAPEFHTRYMNTVIARIFYVINRSWSGQITASELRKSNFLTVLSLLEEEDDINAITDYFSYEHFYVIYCKFWELDTDHNLVIDKHDLLGYGDGVLSSRLIDRVLSGAVTRWDTSDHHLGKMSYVDFVWFILSEEDKKTQTSIEYWYRCMDLDGDGYISMYEMEYFYEEQSQKLEQLDIDPLPFEDCICQILDIVNPSSPGKVSLSDLKKCKMAYVFFDTFFNVAKYLNNEQKDPFGAQNAADGTLVVTSDWDNFAAEEYELLVAEEQSSKLTDMNSPLLDEDGFDLLEEHVKAEVNAKRDSKSQMKTAKNSDEIASELNALNFLETNKQESLVPLAQT